MGRCFYCGAEFEGGVHYFGICPTCVTAENVTQIREYLNANLPANFDELTRIQRRGFSELSEKLDNVASILEWGFEEVVWELRQQTEILRGIDKTLKSIDNTVKNIDQKIEEPRWTEATELRKMGEELRKRGILSISDNRRAETLFNQSKNAFRDAIKLNQLDYRLYVGLAMTYILMGTETFDLAKEALENSIPHAPSTVNQSFSYRLIGRIYFCRNKNKEAAAELKEAVSLSPDEEKCLYDYAQYSALINDQQNSLVSLEKAISKNSIYFYFAQKEKNFDSIRAHVDKLLKKILEEYRQDATNTIMAAKNELDEVLEAKKAYDANNRL